MRQEAILLLLTKGKHYYSSAVSTLYTATAMFKKKKKRGNTPTHTLGYAILEKVLRLLHLLTMSMLVGLFANPFIYTRNETLLSSLGRHACFLF